MDVVRHGKPHGSYLATLRKPTSQDYNKLVKACMEAIISGEIDVIIAFPYVMKFPSGFPKGILERKEGANNIHRIKARKLLTWLHEQGHTVITVEALKRQRAEFTKVENSFDKIWLDESQEMFNNEDSQVTNEPD